MIAVLIVRYRTIRLNKRNMTNPKCLSQFIKRNDCRISATPFKVTQILLTEARFLSNLFLGQALFLPYSLEVLTDEFPHVHASWIADRLDRFNQL